ncbi:uncharacterized protein LOC130323576 isoform X2 [Hyla sarda]|nr:uncharacterized protein LOC130323576 isoform X2 [Hyla sarda]XP_056409139.1 uncharacterized protein LOC130323576 isoform X2 [Hyla sarda]XP_056409140.1 uncharacterized protein LOC130323576 isoform X2 [Hyla sarda]
MMGQRTTLTKNEEIRIQGCGEDGLSWLHSSLKNEPPQEDELCTRYQKNEVATQTQPVYCFTTVDEMMEFLNGSSRCEEQCLEDVSMDGDHVDQALPNDNHMRTLKLEVEEDDEQAVISPLYPPVHCSLTSSPPFPVVKRRRKQRFHCDWQGAVTTISSPSVPAHAMELRVDEDLAMSIRRQVDINNPGPFGWQLAKLLFSEEELYGHNFNGTDQKMPLSPRRVHAIQHAFHDYFPKDMVDEALAKGRTAINQGIRNMFYVRNRRDGDLP